MVRENCGKRLMEPGKVQQKLVSIQGVVRTWCAVEDAGMHGRCSENLAAAVEAEVACSEDSAAGS